MRTLMSGGRVWLARAGESWTARLNAHAFAAVFVGAAFLLQWSFGRTAGEPPFWLFHAAIVLTAAYGEPAAVLVAILLSVLLARVSSAVPMSTALLFGIEGLLIGGVVLYITKATHKLLGRVAGSLRELESAERQRTRLDHALSRLDQARDDTAVILLDGAGCISDWRSGATRLYGFDRREMVGAGAAAMFDERDRADFPRLLTEARGAAIRRSSRQVRADGTTFAAEIEVSPLAPDELDGFAMIVRDLTGEEARAAADQSAVDTHAHLRGEVELAQRQLVTLQELTDPSLNALGADQFVSELLDRLRSAIHAEGVALVQVGRHRPHLLCARDGLQSQRVHHRSGAAVAADRVRTVMIHNDPAAVAEVSAAVWPDDVSSLIAVPLVRAGSTSAVLEVVNRTVRRASEWEIALVQVVASRMAGFLEYEPQVNDAAGTWIAAGASSGSWSLSGSDPRLSLDDRVSDKRESGRERQG